MINLLEMKPNKGDNYNPDESKMLLLLGAITFKTEGHCPCVPKHLRNDNTLCPCLEYRNNGGCRCGLFVNEKV